MNVINAQAVNGTFELIRFDRLKDENRNNAPGKDEYFWRQTLDFTTKKLSVRLVENHVRSDSSTDMLTDPAGHACMVCLWILTT
jgi:hypothetical protein